MGGWCRRARRCSVSVSRLLSAVPALSLLGCAHNQLRQLALTGVPHLSKLWCRANQLMALNLPAVPQLSLLDCGGNRLTLLDIRTLSQLSVFAADPTVGLLGTPPGKRR